MVAASCSMVEFPAKAAIASTSDIFALVDGSADAYIQVGESTAKFELEEGDCFGRQHSHFVITVVTVTPVRCMRVPQGILEEFGLFHEPSQNPNLVEAFG